MNRRELLGVGLSCLLPTVSKGEGTTTPHRAMMYPVMKLDEMSRNGLVVPSDVIRREIGGMAEVPLFASQEDAERRSAPEIGRAYDWQIGDGWLWCRLEGNAGQLVRLDAGCVCRPEVFGPVKGGGNGGVEVFQSIGIASVYIAEKSLESWCGTPYCKSCGSSTRPVDRASGTTTHQCLVCGSQFKGYSCSP